jgi:hypothetical protein
MYTQKPTKRESRKEKFLQEKMVFGILINQTNGRRRINITHIPLELVQMKMAVIFGAHFKRKPTMERFYGNDQILAFSDRIPMFLLLGTTMKMLPTYGTFRYVYGKSKIIEEAVIQSLKLGRQVQKYNSENQFRVKIYQRNHDAKSLVMRL